MSPGHDIARARTLAARLAAILTEQSAPNFLPSVRTLQGLLDNTDTRAGLAAAAQFETLMHGGMGSMDDLVFSPPDRAQFIPVNEEWTNLRADLARLLEPYR